MSLKRIWSILRKDLLTGSRSTVFLFAVIMPLVLTFIFQVVFGTLFNPKPRLGIVDKGESAITASVREMEGIALTLIGDAGELKRKVEENDLDAGLVLPAGFDEAVRAGSKPLLQLYIGGESLASNRLIIAITALDQVRELEGAAAPVEVKTITLGTGAAAFPSPSAPAGILRLSHGGSLDSRGRPCGRKREGYPHRATGDPRQA